MGTHEITATAKPLRMTNIDGMLGAVTGLIRELRTLTEWTVSGRPAWEDVRDFLEDNLTGDEFTFYFSFDKPGIAWGLDHTALRAYPAHPYKLTLRYDRAGRQTMLIKQKFTLAEVEAMR